MPLVMSLPELLFKIPKHFVKVELLYLFFFFLCEMKLFHLFEAFQYLFQHLISCFYILERIKKGHVELVKEYLVLYHNRSRNMIKLGHTAVIEVLSKRLVERYPFMH